MEEIIKKICSEKVTMQELEEIENKFANASFKTSLPFDSYFNANLIARYIQKRMYNAISSAHIAKWALIFNWIVLDNIEEENPLRCYALKEISNLLEQIAKLDLNVQNKDFDEFYSLVAYLNATSHFNMLYIDYECWDITCAKGFKEGIYIFLCVNKGLMQFLKFRDGLQTDNIKIVTRQELTELEDYLKSEHYFDLSEVDVF